MVNNQMDRISPHAGQTPAIAPFSTGKFAMHDNPPSAWPDFLTGQAENPVRVLLVDDDAHIRQVIAQELMADSRTLLVAQAATFREGKRCIRQHAFDVMLLDLNLGDGVGYGLISYMKKFCPAAEAIVVSVLDADQDAMRAFELGAVGFLVKNSWFGNFPQSVLQVVNGGAAITPNLARRLLSKFRYTAGVEGFRAGNEHETLSAREREVLRMVANGYTSGEIGSHMHISGMTVNSHVKSIYRKLHVHTRAQAVSFASIWGLL